MQPVDYVQALFVLPSNLSFFGLSPSVVAVPLVLQDVVVKHLMCTLDALVLLIVQRALQKAPMAIESTQEGLERAVIIFPTCGKGLSPA